MGYSEGVHMRYRVAAPDLSGNESAYVNECLRSTWISSNGPFISKFEASIAGCTNTRHAIATCNGTVALHLALTGLGVGPGDEVIVPSLTFVATANAVGYCGASPVFADSTRDTWCLSVESVARMLSPRTRAVIPVHLYGHPCDMGPLLELARQHGLWIIEDCAEALGATYQSRPVGSFGIVSTFSFYGNKLVTTGEGGMVVTDDEALAERLRLLRGQGMDPQRRYWHPLIGFNYRMTNIAAALGLAQMERFDQLLHDRRQIAAWYNERLVSLPFFVLPVEAAGASSAFWMYSILTPNHAWRESLMADLDKKGIETRPFFYPVHEFPMYQGCRNDDNCPVARDLSYRGLSLPTSSYLKKRDMDVITRELRDLVLHYPSPYVRAA
jgi:perosamine synthetase